MFQASFFVSCLCVTEARPAFLPWLLWNYDKQDHRSRELIVVDSSEDADWNCVELRPDATLLRCPPGTSVARKRNLAVEAARGDSIAWFDDDDWQHPRRLSILAGALAGGAELAGSAQSWFVDLARCRAQRHISHHNVIFNGLAVRRDALEGVRFDERRARAADTAWMASIRCHGARVPVCVPHVLSFWLCHRANLSNPATRYGFPQPMSAVRDAVGAAHWGETETRLAGLRDRLARG